MTDPELGASDLHRAARPRCARAIIERERPDALLPTMGGQTALNLAMALNASGTLDKLGVQLIGASTTAIATAEDREQFKAAMTEIGLQVPESDFAHTVADALEIGRRIGFPLIVRPELHPGRRGDRDRDGRGNARAPRCRGDRGEPDRGESSSRPRSPGGRSTSSRVMRDAADNCVVVCSIENFDPMGVHTGDSITVAPAQTLSDVEYQAMRDDAFACIRRVGVETRWVEHPVRCPIPERATAW